MKRKIRKGFTLVELIVSIAITSILIGVICAFLIFTSNLSTDYTIEEKTLHSANNISIVIRNYLDQYNDGNLEIAETPDTYSESQIFPFLNYDTNNENEFTLNYIANGADSLPSLEIKYNDEKTDTIYTCLSDIKLCIKKRDGYTNVYKFDFIYSENKAISFTRKIY